MARSVWIRLVFVLQQDLCSNAIYPISEILVVHCIDYERYVFAVDVCLVFFASPGLLFLANAS